MALVSSAPCQQQGALFFWVGLLCTLAVNVPAVARPYTPANDGVVLERMIGTPLRRPPQSGDNLDVVVPLAQRHIAQARHTGDPRELGYAQGLLQPWWNEVDAPVQVLLLRATLRQARHDFGGALEDLDRVVEQQPQNAQAWLTRATVLRVQGHFPEALKACDALKGQVDPFIDALCTQAVRSLNGELVPALAEMERMRPRLAAQPADIAAWFEAEHALMAVRSGRAEEALALYAEALIRHPGDLNLRAEYADLLLDSDQATTVLELIPESAGADALQLRRTLALHALSDPAFSAHHQRILDGFAAARRRDEALHLREEARYLLATADDPRAALQLAQKNWRIQREPPDARVLLRAAAAAGDSAAAEPVRQWMRQTRLEDVRLTAP